MPSLPADRAASLFTGNFDDLFRARRELDPVPHRRDEEGNPQPRVILVSGPLFQDKPLAETPYAGLVSLLFKRAPLHATNLHALWEEQVRPALQRLRAVTDQVTADREAAVTACEAERQRLLEETEQLERQAARQEDQLQEILSFWEGALHQAELEALEVSAGRSLAEVNAEGLLPAPMPPEAPGFPTAPPAAAPSSEADSSLAAPAELESPAEDASDADPEGAAPAPKAGPEGVVSPSVEWFVTLVIGMMTGLSIFMLNGWNDPTEGLAEFLGPWRLLGVALLVGIAVAAATKIAITAAWEWAAFAVASRDRWQEKVGPMALAGLVFLALVLLDAAANQQGFMSGAMSRVLIASVSGQRSEGPGALDFLYFFLAMIVMLGYITMMSYHGWKRGRVAGGKVRAQRQREAIQTTAEQESATARQKAMSAYQAALEEIRETVQQRREAPEAAHARIALGKRDYFQRRLLEARLPLEALNERIQALITRREALEPEFDPRGELLIQDRHDNALGLCRMFDQEVQRLLAAFEPLPGQAPAFRSFTEQPLEAGEADSGGAARGEPSRPRPGFWVRAGTWLDRHLGTRTA